jgi:hypothetical protein
MDFGGFTNKIKASAEAAAIAARSFKGFDDMAAQDVYIHSDTLNTPVNRERARSQSSVVAPSSRREREEGDSYSQTGTDTELSEHSGGSSWSLLDRPRHDATPKNEEENAAAAATASRQSRPWHSAKLTSELGTSSMHSLPDTHSHSPPQRQSTMPLMGVVADTLSSSNRSGAREKPTRKKESMSNSATNREDASSSASVSSSENGFSDDDENDPILSMIRKAPPPSVVTKKPSPSFSSSRRGNIKPKPIKMQNQMQFLEMEDASPVPNQKKIKKNPNRFMQELDQRMAMPELDNDDDDMEAGLLSSSFAKAPAEPSFLWGILNGGVGSRKQENSAAVTERKAAPLTRQARWTEPKPVEENYAVVGSSSVLGEDEIRALAQMKESSTRQDMVTACLDKVRRHPRESFIVFTLLLGWLVYFYSRKISLEDDVT